MAKASQTKKKTASENLNISGVEQYIIDKVKEMRAAQNLSQRDLAYLMDVSQNFIASVENPRKRAKYNINHIYKLAVIFKCEMVDLLPPLDFAK